jgi:hypothetical protein
MYESVAASSLTTTPRSSSFDQTRTKPILFPLDISTRREQAVLQDDAMLQNYDGHKRDSFNDSGSMPEDGYYTSPSSSSDEAELTMDEQALKYRVGTARVQSLFGNHKHHFVIGTLLPSPW